MFDALRYPAGSWLVPVPAAVWRPIVHLVGRDAAKTYRRLTPLQQEVRRAAVVGLPGADGPLTPETLAERTGATVEEVVAALDVLERRMSFLFRDPEGAVAWAYPFTTDETPHHLTFSTGERRDAA